MVEGLHDRAKQPPLTSEHNIDIWPSWWRNTCSTDSC